MNRFGLLALLLVAVLCSRVERASAQTTTKDNFGTEFYVGFGPNEGAEGQSPSRNRMALFITSRVATRGKIEIPALNFYKSFTTVPGAIRTIELPNGNQGKPSVELLQNERVIKGMAVHITSDSAIAVFGINHKMYSSDAFMALPVNVLGTEYLTLNYQTSNYMDSYTNPGEFWIVGVEDSTNVTITLRAPSSEGTPAQTPVDIRLDRGDIYLVQGSGDLSNDLTGSHIESDHPVAVFSGHMRTQMPSDAVSADGRPSRDHLVEQMPPVSAWGDSALVVPFKTSPAPDLVRVVSAEDNNDILINGTSVGKLNTGDFYEILEMKGVTSVQASRPILVGQYLHTSTGSLSDPRHPAYGDPALALVFPVEQFSTSYTIVSIEDASAFTGNFVNIVAEQDAVNSMTIDGVPIPVTEFHPIAGSKYVYAQHTVQQGTHTLRADKPFGVTVYAMGNVDSYAYTGGTLLKTITPLETVSLKIDFGDRVLDAALNGKFDTVVELRNVGQDPLNIFAFPRRTQDTGKFHVIDPTPSPAYTLAPGQAGSMTIEFEPRELNRRMHTQVTARTDHLRAYVVDVYGRGVSDELGLFKTPLKTSALDTLDFGIFANTDPPADSAAYVGNAGAVTLTVIGAAISGTDAGDFVLTQITNEGSVASIPFTIPQPPSGAVRMGVQFTPSGANGVRLARLDVSSQSGRTHTVILKAQILTIDPLSLPASLKYDSQYVCDEQTYEIPLSNPNPVTVTLQDITIDGTNAGDYAIVTPTPIAIKPGENASVKIQFQPLSKGPSQATAHLRFDLPKTKPNVDVPLSGNGEKRELMYAGAHGLTNGNDPVLVPIYSRSDLTPFGGVGYNLRLKYDPAHLEFVDIITDGTLTPGGYVAIFTAPGSDTVIFTPIKDKPLVGGGPGSVPLCYLKFQPHLNGEDPQTYSASFDIQYELDLLSPKIPSGCVDRVFNMGTAEILSVCSTPHLAIPDGVPQQTTLERATPNPFTTATTVDYEVAKEGIVSIDVADNDGKVVRQIVTNANMKPGYYRAVVDAGNLPAGVYYVRMTSGAYSRVRKVILSK